MFALPGRVHRFEPFTDFAAVAVFWDRQGGEVSGRRLPAAVAPGV
jgi:hypothetical protein